MSGFLARVRTVLTAAPTYLTALAVIISIFSEEISALLPEGPAGQLSHWAVVAVGWLGAAVTIIRRVTPVIPDERGLIAKGKHEQRGRRSTPGSKNCSDRSTFRSHIRR